MGLEFTHITYTPCMLMPKENESDSACGILITDSRAIKGFYGTSLPTILLPATSRNKFYALFHNKDQGDTSSGIRTTFRAVICIQL